MKKQIVTGLIFLFFVFAAAVSSYSTEEADSVTRPTSEEIKAIQDKYNIPSLCIAVMSEDSLLFQMERGVANINESREVDESMKYQIGSLTKSFTAYIAANLVEEKKISWNSSLFTVLPELRGRVHKGYENVTLADLLSHRGGVDPYSSFKKINSISTFTDRLEFTQKALKKKPRKQGEFSYSNAGYIAAALMLEQVSGKTWNELLQDYIVQRKGIELALGYPVDIDKNNPAGHYVKQKEMVQGRQLDVGPILYPVGGISLSLQEIKKWAKLNLALLSGNDKSLSVHNRDFLYFGREGYAMGWGRSVFEQDHYIQHAGSVGTFQASLAINASSGTASMILMNAGGESLVSALKEINMLLKERMYQNTL